MPVGGPGGEDGSGFLRCGLLRAWAASGGEDDAAELYGHVVVGRFGLQVYQRSQTQWVITSSGACPCRADQRVTTLPIMAIAFVFWAL